MKTTEMSSTLKAFAALVGAERAEELRKFAGTFDSGNDETVAARVKRIAKGLNARTQRLRYPSSLKDSLSGLAAGFSASKAKQAGDFEAIISLFKDAETGASADEFVMQINEAIEASRARTPPRRPAQPRLPNERLVTELANELARTVLDPPAFSKVMARLHDADSVSTPTLGAVANHFLGNSKSYSGRKSAIADITKRQEQDARAHARGKALDRIPV
jgi:hypothetical protein